MLTPIAKLIEGTTRMGGKALAFGAVHAAGGALGAAAKLSGSAAGRTIMGAGVGGMIGAIQGYDVNSRIEGFAKGALLGGTGVAAARIGMRHGGKVIAAGYKGSKFLLKANMAGGASAAARAGMKQSFLNKVAMSPAGRATRGIGRAGMFAIDHPAMLLGAVGAVYAGSRMMDIAGQYSGTAQSMGSPGLEGSAMHVDYNKRAIMTAELGKIGTGTIGPPEDMQQMFNYQDWMQSVGRSVMANTRTGRLASSALGLPQGLHAGRHG